MDRINFIVNGIECSVGCEVSSDTMLVDYIRNYLELRGTKYMCREAGCGACIVSVAKSPGASLEAVNSCLVSVTSCEGWEITTIEKVGNKRDGYNALQKVLAKLNGTQCGYCSPGWIMAMYSLQNKKDFTMLEIEKSFGSNICRCTGYRPILEAFKKFAKDSPDPIVDIEDVPNCVKSKNSCFKTNYLDSDWCIVPKINQTKMLKINLEDEKYWYTVYDLKDVFHILQTEGVESYMLVAGNSAKVPYPIEEYPKILIDISQVAELKGFTVDQNLIIGGGTTITDLLDILEATSARDGFNYLQKLHDHIQLVAHVPVRNLGTIAGNLMIKHQHNEFPSDIYLLLETCGAQLTILHCSGNVTVNMEQFLNLNMKGKIILNVLLPPLSDEYKLITFKIMPRSQSVHAIVNAGFLYKLDKDNIVLQSRIVYGNLSPEFNRAMRTERQLLGNPLFTNKTLQTALKTLTMELKVTENPPEPSAFFRKQLALNLFYKGLLSLCPKDTLHPCYRSGDISLHKTRPVSQACQVYDTNTSLWPLNQPLEKVEALIQCSGEAHYAEDLPSLPNEVFAAFVLSTVPLGEIESIDATKALKEPGVIAFYTAEDIPGINSFTPNDVILYTAYEEVLCAGVVKYFNQPIAIIAAETQQIADRVSKMVQVTYKNITKPVIDIKEAKTDPNRNTLYTAVDAQDKGSDIAKVIKNNVTMYGQYHFTMETQVCVTEPSEEGLLVHSAAQWPSTVQSMIAKALNIKQNKIDVQIRRIGGGYGSKLSRNIQTAVACSLVTYKLNRPCRFIQPMTTNMRAMGKRLPSITNFEVAVDSSGVIQYANLDVYKDNGYKISEDEYALCVDAINNCYDIARWNYKCYNTITDTASNTYCRAPGTLDNIAAAELIMEQISYELSLDPLEVRLANLDVKKYSDVKEMVEDLKTISQYSERRIAIDEFNATNRWKKRGLRFCIIRWTPVPAGTYSVIMSVFQGDGTVAITHGGVEMGQGINTKAVQICAYMLKIPVENVQIKRINTAVVPNQFFSGGSLTTQNIGIAVTKSCEQLIKRLEPLKNQMDNPTWEQLVKKAFDLNMDLQTQGFYTTNEFEKYDTFGAALAEVELDILTSESEVLRVDLIEDVGQSVNPDIDIGQVEGAFIMGLGFWTCEGLVYDPKTGEVLTDRPWHYHVPQARDIPQDFRVHLRKKSFGTASTFGSKCVGEPPMCLSIVVPCAIREAIASARLDSGIPTSQWFQIDGPYSLENIGMATATRLENLKFY